MRRTGGKRRDRAFVVNMLVPAFADENWIMEHILSAVKLRFEGLNERWVREGVSSDHRIDTTTMTVKRKTKIYTP